MTHSDQHRYVVCRALDTDLWARARGALLARDLSAVLDGLRVACRNAGASGAYLCVDAAGLLTVVEIQAALGQTPGEASAGDASEIVVVPVAPVLVLADDGALLRVLEGRQAVPYVSVPPSAPPTLWGRPAAVYDVEELLGPAAGGPATRTVTVWAGDMARVTDVPETTTVREVLRDVAGIDAGDGGVRAVRFGGACGRFLAGPGLDTPIGPADAWLPAVVEILPGGSCGVAIVGDALRALAADSCGACAVCREGIRQLTDMLADVAGSRASAEAPGLMRELGAALESGSLCGLGLSAADVLRSGLEVFAGDFAAHLEGAPCPEARADA